MGWQFDCENYFAGSYGFAGLLTGRPRNSCCMRGSLYWDNITTTLISSRGMNQSDLQQYGIFSCFQQPKIEEGYNCILILSKMCELCLLPPWQVIFSPSLMKTLFANQAVGFRDTVLRGEAEPLVTLLIRPIVPVSFGWVTHVYVVFFESNDTTESHGLKPTRRIRSWISISVYIFRSWAL